MSEPTLIHKQALARAELLRKRLKELRGDAASARSIIKVGLINHLIEDERQLDMLIDLLRQSAEGTEE